MGKEFSLKKTGARRAGETLHSPDNLNPHNGRIIVPNGIDLCAGDL